jgi:hypothetical protein
MKRTSKALVLLRTSVIVLTLWLWIAVFVQASAGLPLPHQPGVTRTRHGSTVPSEIFAPAAPASLLFDRPAVPGQRPVAADASAQLERLQRWVECVNAYNARRSRGWMTYGAVGPRRLPIAAAPWDECGPFPRAWPQASSVSIASPTTWSDARDPFGQFRPFP